MLNIDRNTRLVRWSGTVPGPTVLSVPKTDPDRIAFRRRLGHTLVRLREFAGMTQEDVAGELGIDADSLSRWENAKNELRVWDLARLAKLYGAQADWLLDPTDSITELDLRLRQRADAGLQTGAGHRQEQRRAS